MNEPTFAEQHRFERAVRDVVRRAHCRATGRLPTEAELAPLVAAEIDQLRVTGDHEVIARALAADPLLVPPEPDLVAAWMTDRQRREAEEALWFAKLHNIASVPEALAWYVTYSQSAKVSPPLRTCVEQFQRVRRAQGLRPQTMSVYESRFKPLCEQFGDRLPNSITAEEIAGYLKRWEKPTTRLTQWDGLNALWHWLIKSGYALENPVGKGMRRPTVKISPGLIFTPREAKIVLTHVKHTDQVGFWALSLFAGLWRNELEQLQLTGRPWAAVDRTAAAITLNERVSAQPRRITIMPVLDQWLAWMKAQNAPFYPPNHYDKFRIARALALAARYSNAADRASGKHGYAVGGKGTFGMARRSFISYRLALAGASFADIADEVARHETNIRSRFFMKAGRADAEAFFALGPDAV